MGKGRAFCNLCVLGAVFKACKVEGCNLGSNFPQGQENGFWRRGWRLPDPGSVGWGPRTLAMRLILVVGSTVGSKSEMFPKIQQQQQILSLAIAGLLGHLGFKQLI